MTKRLFYDNIIMSKGSSTSHKRRVCVVKTVQIGARCIQNYDFTRLLRFSVKVFFVFLLKNKKRAVFYRLYGNHKKYLQEAVMCRIAIGENIRRYRNEKNMTQEEFGQLLGISAQAISKWENEKNYPDIVLLPDIARLMGMQVGNFFVEEERN